MTIQLATIMHPTIMAMMYSDVVDGLADCICTDMDLWMANHEQINDTADELDHDTISTDHARWVVNAFDTGLGGVDAQYSTPWLNALRCAIAAQTAIVGCGQ